jgi:arsenical-resistance protein 2
MATTQEKEAPWWAAFGEPKAKVGSVPASTVLADLEAQPLGDPNVKRRFILVDVRRTDYEGGTIASSINLPAHTIYQTRAIIYQLCKQAGVEQIIFYCGKQLSFSLSFYLSSLDMARLRRVTW